MLLFVEYKPNYIFSEENIWKSFKRLEDAFVKALSQHDVDVATLGTDIEIYCEDRFGDCKPNFAVSTVKELLACVKRLPYHNIFNVEVLGYLASCSSIDYLEDLVEQYQTIFFSKPINELLQIANTRQIQLTTEDETFVISSLTSSTKLKKDVTITELSQFIIEYSKAILYLKAGVAQPSCIEQGCVCIKWLIPMQLANYAFHSACLNIKLFEQYSLKYLSVGRYKAELVEGSLKSK